MAAFHQGYLMHIQRKAQKPVYITMSKIYLMTNSGDTYTSTQFIISKT